MKHQGSPSKWYCGVKLQVLPEMQRNCTWFYWSCNCPQSFMPSDLFLYTFFLFFYLGLSFFFHSFLSSIFFSLFFVLISPWLLWSFDSLLGAVEVARIWPTKTTFTSLVTKIQYVDWYMTLTSTRRWELMNWVWMSWCYNIGSTCTCCRCPIT